MLRILKYSLLPLFFQAALAQNADSLKQVLARNDIADTVRIQTLNKLASFMRKSSRADTALLLTRQTSIMAGKIGYKWGLAKSYVISSFCYGDLQQYPEQLVYALKALQVYAGLGYMDGMLGMTDNVANTYNYMGNYRESLKYHRISLRLSEIAGDKEGLASTYNNMGTVYSGMGNFAEALKYHFLALGIREKLGDKQLIAQSLSNLGNGYYEQKNYVEALKNYRASQKLCIEINDAYGKAVSYNNIGTVCTEIGKYEEALQNHFASLAIKQELGDKDGLTDSYSNIGLAYANLNNDSAAFRFYNHGLKLAEELEDIEAQALLCGNIGLAFYRQKKIAESRKYLDRQLILAKQGGSYTHIITGYERLALLDSLAGDNRASLNNYKLYIVYRDSVSNEENTKKSVQAQMLYEFDKKEAAAKLEQEKKDAVAAAETRRQRIVLFAISGFGLLVLGFAIFAYRSFLQKKKANTEISNQKELIEEKQKEILDSIYYARRIQRSLMTNEWQIQKYLERLMK